jgi:DNA-binding CsgD family transcriptional regulator
MYQPERALHYIDQGLRYTDDYDLNTYNIYLLAIRGLALLRRGEWAEAERVSRLALAELASYGYVNRANLNCYMALGCLAARRGDPEAQTIAKILKEVDNELIEMPDEAGFIHLTCAEIAWYHGDPAACTTEAYTLLDVIGNRPHAWYRGQALYWLWRCGEPVDLTEGIAEPYRLQIEGNWRGAAAAWEQRACRYEQAMALADGDEAALREAFAILDRLGAHAAMDYVRRRLREIGVDSVPRGMNISTRENITGLTRRQSEVLALLKQELTNTEIAARLHISPKTVEHHVSAILARLEVTTREDAIRVAGSFSEKT